MCTGNLLRYSVHIDWNKIISEVVGFVILGLLAWLVKMIRHNMREFQEWRRNLAPRAYVDNEIASAIKQMQLFVEDQGRLLRGAVEKMLNESSRRK